MTSRICSSSGNALSSCTGSSYILPRAILSLKSMLKSSCSLNLLRFLGFGFASSTACCTCAGTECSKSAVSSSSSLHYSSYGSAWNNTGRESGGSSLGSGKESSGYSSGKRSLLVSSVVIVGVGWTPRSSLNCFSNALNSVLFAFWVLRGLLCILRRLIRLCWEWTPYSFGRSI